MDWVAWHTDYEGDSPLRRRLEIVQRHIVDALRTIERSPVRVISMCAGEARDLRGALAQVERRDLVGRLVELDAGLAENARRGLAELGVSGVEVVTGDAGEMGAYRGTEPADLVLECGVFGNISDEDVERTIRASPMFCAPGATLIWTRHRRPPDLTDSVRRWYAESGFAELAFEAVPDSNGSVGVVRYQGPPVALSDQRLFTFTRTTDDPAPG
ncbi:MAG TPA: class I SAM-dependent methyltransferase [Candidatus Limnocylindria bacterium]|nr:class I SAM-dependent methyltransferase [Candidatus Limnocylindria bacterium]